ncbi:MAG: UvrD-helicase domain-containing protein, partial [Acholeplasmatales bacterium]|nr:UvrD-helicase domain-containing protein [Acholeplasmatales bacterium]
MAFIPNPSQELALRDWGKNVLVSAGAGSGKTAVLTERIKRIIESGVLPTRLLVLTFTKDAANEMKTRVKTKLSESDELKKYLPSLEQAYFTTFDSFSLSFCKKYSYMLSLGQDISIVEEATISVKKVEILKNIFNEYLKNDNQIFKEYLSFYTTKSIDQAVDKIL